MHDSNALLVGICPNERADTYAGLNHTESFWGAGRKLLGSFLERSVALLRKSSCPSSRLQSKPSWRGDQHCLTSISLATLMSLRSCVSSLRSCSARSVCVTWGGTVAPTQGSVRPGVRLMLRLAKSETDLSLTGGVFADFGASGSLCFEEGLFIGHVLTLGSAAHALRP